MKRKYLVPALLAAFGILFAGAAPAAVPPSVAVRTQPPEIEKIIAALETKARSAVGTWHTLSGRQGATPEPWTTGISLDKAWYWASDAQPPASSSGYSLYDDGENACVPTYGPNHALGGIRFQYDSIRNGFSVGAGDATQNYTLGYYLLHMNLLPRQFIGALGGLSKIGAEQLDGAPVIHLRADPKADELAQADIAGNPQITAYSKNNVDLFYDPQRQAIVKVILTPDGGSATQLQLRVSAWNTFNTSETWPASFVGRQTGTSLGENNAGPPRQINLGPPTLTMIQQFIPGNDARLVELQKHVQNTELFVTPPPALRTRAFYEHALAQHENAHDRTALATVFFLENDVRAGLSNWDMAALHLSPDSHRLLNRALLPIVSKALVKSIANKDQQPACITLLTRSPHSLSDEEFLNAGDGIDRAWEILLQAPETHAIALSLGVDLLPRLAKTNSVFIIERLIRAAKISPDNAALIDPCLRAIFDQPVPISGLQESSQDLLFVASLRADDLHRAENYLHQFQWQPQTKQVDIQVSQTWQEALGVVQRFRSDDETSLPVAIAIFQTFGAFQNNRTDQVYGKWLLSQASADFLQARLAVAEKKQPITLLKDTAQISGASEFWRGQISLLAKNTLLNRNVFKQIDAMVQTCGQTFSLPDFEYQVWLQLITDSQIRGKDLDLQMLYANRALDAARDDQSRARVIASMGQIFAATGQYNEAAEVIEAHRNRIHTEPVLGLLDTAVQSLKAQAAGKKLSSFPGISTQAATNNPRDIPAPL